MKRLMKNILLILTISILLVSFAACTQAKDTPDEPDLPDIDVEEGIVILPDDLSNPFVDLYGGNEKRNDNYDIKLTAPNIMYDFEEEDSFLSQIVYVGIMARKLNTDMRFVRTGSGSVFFDMHSRNNYGRAETSEVKFKKYVDNAKKILMDVYVVSGPEEFRLDINVADSTGLRTAYVLHPRYNKDLTTKYRLSEVKDRWITLEIDLTKTDHMVYKPGYEPYTGKLNPSRISEYSLSTPSGTPGEPPIQLYLDNVRIEK